MSRLSILFALLCAVVLTPIHAAAEPTPEQIQSARVSQAMLMSALFDLRKSRLGFDKTVAAIRLAAERRGWRVGPTQDAGAAMQQAGVKDAPRIKVIPTCPPEANQRLASVTIAQGKPVPPLPCRITVLVDKDKQVQIVKINTAHLARAAKGDALARVMGEIAAEEEAMLKGIVD